MAAAAAPEACEAPPCDERAGSTPACVGKRANRSSAHPVRPPTPRAHPFLPALLLCRRAYVRQAPSLSSQEPAGDPSLDPQAAARFVMTPDVRKHVCKYVYADEWSVVWGHSCSCVATASYTGLVPAWGCLMLLVSGSRA